MDVRIVIDDARVMAALKGAPEAMHSAMDAALARGAEEMARAAREAAPKSQSTLTNSIRADRVAALHYEIAPGVNYARAVEEGTGPAAGRPKYYPNPDALQQYVMTNPRARGFDLAKKGSGKREQQRYDVWHRSRAFAWWIYQHGTKAQPFMRPAFDATRERVRDLVIESMRQVAHG
jgi:HK97 gp10 family phage protein